MRHLVPAAFLLALAGLPIVGFLFPAAWVLWAGLLALYVALILVASLTTARRRGDELLLYLPIVFACFHIGYGLGFLQGVFDFNTGHVVDSFAVSNDHVLRLPDIYPGIGSADRYATIN